jgi:hypothetical protein
VVTSWCDGNVEVFNAPKRRVDNEVSRLSDSLQLLQMHCKIMEDIQGQYRTAKLKFKAFQLGLGTAFTGLGGAVFYLQSNIELALASGVTGAALVGLIGFWESRSMRQHADNLIEQPSLEAAFRRQYARKIAEKDEDTMTRWIRVLEILKIGLNGPELQRMPKVSASDIKTIESKINDEVPKLRRAAGPALKRHS